MSIWGNPVLIGEREIIPEPPLPAEYQQVEYMDFTPPAGFLVTIPKTFIVEAKVSTDTNTKNEGAFGYRLSTSSDVDFLIQITSSRHNLEWWTRGTGYDPDRSIAVTPGETYVIRGMACNLRTTAFIGRYATYSSASYYGWDGKIYYVKGWDIDNNLSFKFVPCYRKADSVPGWYDVVAGVFYSTLDTTGGGSIALGPDAN